MDPSDIFTVAARVLRGTRRLRESARCPVSGRPVTLEWEMDTWHGRRAEVASCTTFDPPTAVTCHRACVPREAVYPVAP